MRVYSRRLYELEVDRIDSELTREIAVDATCHEPGIGEDAPVLGLAAVVPPFQVAFHVVTGRVRFQERDTVQEAGEVTHATFQGCVGHVLQDVGAYDQIEPATERQRRELLERAELDVAPPAVLGDHVLAGVDANIPDVGAQAPQLGAPRALTGADVEHGAQLAAEEILGDPSDQTDLSTNGLRE